MQADSRQRTCSEVVAFNTFSPLFARLWSWHSILFGYLRVGLNLHQTCVMQAESAHSRLSCLTELQAPCAPKSPHFSSLTGASVAGFPVQLPWSEAAGMSSLIDATGRAEYQGLKSWALPGVTLFGQYCLCDLQNRHLKLPWGL